MHRRTSTPTVPRSYGTLLSGRGQGRLTSTRSSAFTMAEHYGEQRGQGLGDQDWIAETARREWIAFHKTDAIRRNEAEKVAVRRRGARCFCVPRAKRYLDILVAIAEAVVEPGPLIYSVYPDRIKLVPLD